MKTIKFNKVDYKIPTKWEDVTLKMQMEVSQVASEQKHVKTLGILAGYTGIPVEDLRSTHTRDLERVMKHLTFINEPIPDKEVLEFDLDGHHYIVPPTIIEQEFQDYVAIQTAIAEYKDNQWLLTPFILAVMAKRDGTETLDEFNINERAKEFGNIPVTIANSVAGFFLNSIKVSKFISASSSPEAQTEAVLAKSNELKHSLSQLKKQRGGNLLMRLWIMITQRFIVSSKVKLEKYFNSQASKP